MRPSGERWFWWLVPGLALAVWAVRVLPALGPGPPDGLYNSDSAIPVLMSNLAVGAPFDWLYWGQDRFGAWPFLVARVLALPFGAAWTPHGLHLLQSLLWVSTLLPLGRLAGRAWVLASVAWLAMPALSPPLARTVLDVGHVDGWQLPMLLWGWWGIRRAASASRTVGALTGSSLAAALATWTSLVSAPLLFCLAILEGARAGAPWRRRVWLLLPVAVGVGTEMGVRHRWHIQVRALGWRDVRTPASFDAGFLMENAAGVLRVARDSAALPWLLGAMVLGLGMAWRLRADRQQPSGPWTAVAASLCTAVGLGLLVVVRHVRENAYAPRYLGIPLTFAVIAVALLADDGARWVLRRWSLMATGRLLALGGLGALVLFVPQARPDPREERLRPLAAALAARYPGAVVVDSYWSTYAVAALAPPGALVPLPADGEWNRRPDWVAVLSSGRPVLVGNQGPLAGPGPPPPERTQHGIRLWLVEPDTVVIPPERLSLYGPRPPAQ